MDITQAQHRHPVLRCPFQLRHPETPLQIKECGGIQTVMKRLKKILSYIGLISEAIFKQCLFSSYSPPSDQTSSDWQDNTLLIKS